MRIQGDSLLMINYKTFLWRYCSNLRWYHFFLRQPIISTKISKFITEIIILEQVYHFEYSICNIRFVDLGGLLKTCSSRNQRFACSNLDEDDVFFQDTKILSRTPGLLHWGGIHAKSIWKQDPEANIWVQDREWRRLNNEKLHSFYRAPTSVIKSRRLRWAGHVARMECFQNFNS